MKNFLKTLTISLFLVFTIFAGPRSPKWSGVRQDYIEANPVCEVCGRTKLLQVHHILPVNAFPDKELDPTNLITLCSQCHLYLGHGGNYRYYFPEIRVLAGRVKSGELSMRVAKKFAKKYRVPNKPRNK